jgi:hypothetical protein
MASFDQRGQHIAGNQYNAAHDINFGTVQNPADLIVELEKLKEELSQAQAKGVLSEEVATDAQYRVTKAVQETKKPTPNKKTIVEHLNAAKSVIEGITAAGGMVSALVGAIQIVQKLFS